MGIKIVISEEEKKQILDLYTIKEQKGRDDKKNANISSPKSESKFNEMVSILENARTISWDSGITKTLFNNPQDIKEFAIAILAWTSKNPQYDPKLLMGSISLLFRESKASTGSFLAPKEMWGFITNLVNFDPLNFKEDFKSNHSQGYAQIQPSTAKKYGINMNTLFSIGGSLDAIYKILNSNYELAKKYYSGSNLTIFENNTLKSIPALDNDAAFHIAIAAHNAGSEIITNWCRTNIPNIANPCSEVQRNPYNDVIAITDKSKKIDNYFPKKGDVYNYMSQIFKSFNAMRELPKIILLSKPPQQPTPTRYQKYMENPMTMQPGKI